MESFIKMQDNSQNPFIGWTTIEDAARVVGRNRVTIQNWARHGYIACHRVGPKIEVVNIEQVRSYSEKHPPYSKRVFDKSQKQG